MYMPIDIMRMRKTGVALSASASPNSANSSSATAGSQTTNTVTVTPAGGTSPYTYSWARLSGDTTTTISNSTLATVNWTATLGAANPSRISTWRCTVTDNVSATTTVDVNVDLEYTGP